MFGGIPTIGLEAASYALYLNNDTYYAGMLIGIGVPATVLYWLSMSMIYRHNKRTYQYFNSICFLILFIPLGIMWPLYSAGGITKTTFWLIVGILFFGGTFVFCL